MDHGLLQLATGCNDDDNIARVTGHKEDQRGPEKLVMFGNFIHTPETA